MSNKKFAESIVISMKDFNSDYGKSWSMGSNWDNQGTEFETYINKYLFPKLNDTNLIDVPLGNRFDWLAKEKEFIGQYSEEYVIADSIPVSLNLSKPATLMLQKNYPKMITKIFGQAIIKKTKFTLNDNDVRLNFLTIGDAVNYAMSIYSKRISDINVTEELEIKGMLIDYSMNHTIAKEKVTSYQELENTIFEKVLNVQNNSSKYNESKQASGGAVARYTTKSELSNLCILTTDKVKTYLLNTKIANTFQTAGIDLTDHIISFDDLGGCFKLTKDVTVNDTDTLAVFEAMGDYQITKGDVIYKDSVITFDVSELADFKGNVIEVKPDTEFYSYVFDIRKLRYERTTKNMLKKPFYDGEQDAWTYWLHYPSRKNMSPFFNNYLIH